MIRTAAEITAIMSLRIATRAAQTVHATTYNTLPDDADRATSREAARRYLVARDCRIEAYDVDFGEQ